MTLALIRKTIDESEDWLSALNMLLYYYRIRPHSVTGISPMHAMCAWTRRPLIVDEPLHEVPLSAWVEKLYKQAAVVRNFVEEHLLEHDFIDDKFEEHCSYVVGSDVMLLRSDRCQKRLTPFESGWVISEVVSLSVSNVSALRDRYQPNW